MKKTKLIRGAIMAVFVLLALLLVYTVVKQTMPDIIPLLQSGDEEALEAYLERDMSFTGILCMALLQMVQVLSLIHIYGPALVFIGQDSLERHGRKLALLHRLQKQLQLSLIHI